MAATRDEFVEFFNEKKKGVYACPVCAHTGLGLHVGLGMDGDGTAPPHPMVIGAYEFYMMSCTNCGFTSTFAASPFDDWKAKKAEGKK